MPITRVARPGVPRDRPGVRRAVGRRGVGAHVPGRRGRDVASVTATHGAFAALTRSGTVVAWGDPEDGGDSSAVQHLLSTSRA